MQADLWNRPLELYLRAETTRPYQFQLQAAAARELMLRGQIEEARALAIQSKKAGPWYPVSSMLLGYIAFKQGDLAVAVDQLGDALNFCETGTPVHDFSRLHLAMALSRQNASVEHIRKVLMPLLQTQRGAHHQAAILLLLDVYLANGQRDDALKAVSKAIQLHPGEPKYPQILKDLETTQPDPVAPAPR